MNRGAAVLIAVALSSVARGQDPQKYEVSLRRESVVGDAIKRSKHYLSVFKQQRLQEGKAVATDEKTMGYDSVQTDEVKGAAENGEFTLGKRVYLRWFDQTTQKELPVKGLVVEHARAEDRTFSWKKLEGGDVPPMVQKDLDNEVKRMTKNAADRAAGKDMRDPMLPPGPVAVGERWEVPIEKACQTLNLNVADVKVEGSRVTGILQEVEPEGEWRRVKVAGTIILGKIFGFPATAPGKYSFEMTIRVRPNDIEATYTSRGTLKGTYFDAASGDSVAVDHAWESRDERVLFDPENPGR